MRTERQADTNRPLSCASSLPGLQDPYGIGIPDSGITARPNDGLAPGEPGHIDTSSSVTVSQNGGLDRTARVPYNNLISHELQSERRS
jgi:hypothetical protein